MGCHLLEEKCHIKKFIKVAQFNYLWNDKVLLDEHQLVPGDCLQFRELVPDVVQNLT